MTLDWLLSPITHYALVGLALMGSLLLWICNARELRAVRTNAMLSCESIDATVKGLSESVEEIRETMQTRTWNAPAPAMPAMAAALPGGVTIPVPGRINATTRAQALLLHLRGESSERISGLIGVPRMEVELLCKLNRLLHPGK